MELKIIERQKLLIAGIINCGKDVTDIDIHVLWNIFSNSEPSIPNPVEKMWFELHVGNTLGNGVYSVMAGVEIKEVVELPIEVSLRVIPAGKYAYFSHCMKDGGFSETFSKIDTWIKESEIKVKDFGLQAYDQDFDPKNENSILHIFIPLI